MASTTRPLVRFSLVVAFLLAASAARAQDPSTSVASVARMEQVMQSYVQQGTFMGTVLVARDGAVIFDKAYGMANLELDVPNTPTTKFRLGSITKQFTAAAILLLEERGKLKVADRVKAYLPDAPMSWDRITVQNLLTHTSGIPNFTDMADYGTIKLSSRTASARSPRFAIDRSTSAPASNTATATPATWCLATSSKRSAARATRISLPTTFSSRSA